MPLAYAFWHAPAVRRAPRLYEDWYPVTDWAGLGTLNEHAVTGARRPPHAAVLATGPVTLPWRSVATGPQPIYL